jgi:ATP adenylyltransferase
MSYILREDEYAKQKGCIFCLEKGETQPDPDRLILWVGRSSLVMMNRYPYNNGHLLISPRRHAPEPGDLTEAEMADLMRLVVASVEIFRKFAHPAGFNIGLNLGEAAGAGIAAHLHFHVVPRWNGDTNFMPVFSEVRVIPEHLTSTYSRLRPYFDQVEDRS